MGRNFFYGLLTVAAAIIVAYASPQELSKPCTKVAQGSLCGELIKTRSGRTVAAYKGIPYAKPPVGPLRFKDPQPAEGWTGTKNANLDLPFCIQKNYFDVQPQVKGQEDCLYLNVFTPQVGPENSNSKEKYPVMFYIHEGGWFFGSGGTSSHGPEYIMDENVVLVTFNYRLSVFGFLSTLDDAASGNWALKDQVLALQWVRDNIGSFGGDSNSITIFGQSAGAASVQLLMLSPKTKGMFHRAISQSGSALDIWSTPVNSLQVAQAQAQFVGCPTDKSNSELVQCLRQIDATTLLNSMDNFKFWSIEPISPYIISVEKKTAANPNPLIPDIPLNLLKNLTHSVPHITGIVGNEGIIRAAAYTAQVALRIDINSRWKDLGPKILGLAQSFPNNLPAVPEFWHNMSDFYMYGDDFINIREPIKIQGMIDMYGDRGFIYGVYQAAKYFAKKGGEPVYFYKNDFVGRDSWSNYWAGLDLATSDVHFKFNRSHCDDLNLLFRIPALFPEPFPENSLDTKMSKKLVTMWTNFAKYGKPAENWSPIPKQEDKFRYLHITGPEQMAMKSNFLTQRMDFWKNSEIYENR